ncbi:phosphoglycerate mutase-like protein [Suillus discolor]|uniref:Phosphoglycerate mutase-like protein n=1 Tax=Suillus discolor TaxID=1912936 RepID=A0A9P7FCD5_9AGAM|nr:phosphoglycerate mutase-like protein [Suillus discolor]KAG2111630.1 phosphoglycerate mutase-like protein [Suillus discolor]
MFVQGILNWLTLASLTFNSHKHEDEDPLKRLANLTPYRVAPASHKVEAELPGDCSVDRVMLLHRHGSRGPSGSEEVALINSLVQTLRNGHDALQDADLPENLRFLQTGKGYESHLVPENLTIIGREQLFSHGVEFGLKYPNFTTETLLSSTTQRVIDSMYFFAQGRFGREAEDKDLLTVNDIPDPVSWITPWNSCPGIDWHYASKVGNEWSNSYLPKITERLNDLLPYDVSFNDNNTHGALYACAYDLAAGYESPWCDVFYEDELADFEYELDLIMVASVGYLVPNNAGRIMGSVFVNKLINRFSNTSGEAQSLYLEFGHDATIMAAMAAMDLNKDEPQLSPEELRPHRRFRTSYQTPFAAQMIWESFTCKESFDGPQIRLVLNEETYPLRTCAETKKDRRFGTCSLDAFTRANKFSTDIEFNDDTWQAACGARMNAYQSLNHQQSLGYLLH